MLPDTPCGHRDAAYPSRFVVVVDHREGEGLCSGSVTASVSSVSSLPYPSSLHVMTSENIYKEAIHVVDSPVI